MADITFISAGEIRSGRTQHGTRSTDQDRGTSQNIALHGPTCQRGKELKSHTYNTNREEGFNPGIARNLSARLLEQSNTR
jgi:hypothetical protein